MGIKEIPEPDEYTFKAAIALKELLLQKGTKELPTIVIERSSSEAEVADEPAETEAQ